MNKISFAIILLGVFFTSCEKDEITPTVTSNCDFSSPTESSSKNYAFDGTLSNHFTQTNRWESIDAVLQQTDNQIQLTASGTNISEAWLTHTQQMPYNKSWEFSVEVTIPSTWNTANGNEPQVGVGIFAGKPESSGPSTKVYECNVAVVGNGERFVQGQLVANRLGEDPVRVDHKVLSNNLEVAVIKLQYCTSSHTLTLLLDDETIGTQAIDSSGSDNWGLSDSDMIDIGIMGFAENTNINSNAPIIDDFSLKIY